MLCALVAWQAATAGRWDLSHEGEWPDAAVKSQEHEGPAVTRFAGEAADLGRRRRRVEPTSVPAPGRESSLLLPRGP